MALSVDTFKSNIRQGMAMTNLYRVILPSLPGANSTQINALCKAVSMPGRQILTTDRPMGMKMQKVAYGHAAEDVNLTFHLLQDYGVKTYFDTWQKLAINQEEQRANYKKEYAYDVIVQQLRKDAIIDLGFNVNLGILGSFGADIITPDQVAFTCILEDAFPTTVNSIEFSNETDQMGELSVQLSYTNWREKEGGPLSKLLNFLR
jgi:hypothetical protein